MMRRRIALAMVALVALASFGWAALRVTSSGRGMTASAQDFLASLNEQQRQTATMDYDDAARVDWHFIPKDTRKGVRIKDMNDAQRRKARKLLRSCLGKVGFDKATMIMAMEGVLRELEKANPGRFARDPELYYFTIFGDPSTESRWGLSIEGHHMSLNFVIHEGEVVSSTPTVLCANPTIIPDDLAGSPKGTRVLAVEELLAFELLDSLEGDHRSTAVIDEQAPREVRAAGEAQPPQEDAVGLAAGEMDEQQQAILRALLSSYLSTVNGDVAAARVDAIEEAGFDHVHFAWAGASKPGTGHYYRIQGPTFLVEFVNTQPDAAGNPASHIHLIWRDTAGDFGVPIK
ncbi:MAG: DUF3500 domain-containing protein [Planctomycetota bacterium]|nr:DUF3500 domain-containing protein [Planctomycetota bacterium]